MFDVIFTSAGLISLATLTLMEIVLGIDNIVFISILTDKLPKHQQDKARIIGLSLALFTRILLLLGITWLIGWTQTLLTVFDHEFSGRDLILLAGGLFLLFKSTTEIHSKTIGEDLNAPKKVKYLSFSNVIFQILLLDIVFSFDSILTAVGLAKEVIIMVVAVVISMIVMILFSGVIARFVNTHPTVKMLALSFLLMIGLLLVIEAFEVHVPKGYVYFAMAFSLFVELLNMRMRRSLPKAT
ncbi:MAG: TerC family protein [Bacteroidia bacterium]|jgi:predicted tellurium resistance membrane protein TerC